MRTTKGACLTPRSFSDLVRLPQALDNRTLHLGREVTRLVQLVVQGDRFQEVRQRAHGLSGRGVLPRRHRRRPHVGREVQEVGFDAARGRVLARVRVNRQKEIRPLAVGDGRPLRQRHEVVGAPRQNHLGTRHLLKEFLDAQRDIEHERRLADRLARGAWIVASMTRIDDDAGHAQPELPRHRIPAAHVLRWPDRRGARVVVAGSVCGRGAARAAAPLERRQQARIR